MFNGNQNINMVFNRPPRIRRSLSPEKYKFPSPPVLPTKPSMSWLAVGLPLLLTALVIGGMVYFMPSSSSASYLLFLPLMLVSGITTIITYFVQKADYEKAVVKAQTDYEQELKQNEADLKLKIDERRTVLDGVDPDIQKCIQRAVEVNIRLGERRPEDEDFLSFRIGLADHPSNLEFEVPQEDKSTDVFKDNFHTIEHYRDIFSKIGNAPFIVNLKNVGCLGIASQNDGNKPDEVILRDKVRNVARASLMQLCSHHWPSEVEVISYCHLSEYDEWKWLKNVPHKSHLLPTQVTPVVVLGSSEENVNSFNLTLEEELRRRQANLDRRPISSSEEGAPSGLPMPALVILFDHIPDLYDQPAFALILQKGRSLNVYGIFLEEWVENIPGECGAFIEVNSQSITYKETGSGKSPIEKIQSDQPTLEEAQKLADALGNIEYLIPSLVTDPPDFLTLLDLFNTPDLNNLPVEEWWEKRSDKEYLRTPIGKVSPNISLYLDLNEGAHGPHGIIGGTTGSGKSELLKTIVLSYALTHHPYDINFALIDYKGGSAFKGLEALPHVVGVITDIENNADYARRVVLALEGEIKKREKILKDAKKRGIIPEADIKYYKSLVIKQPMPHLIIIFDEFAEFRDQHPEESQKLVSFFRKGRSLGVHLILCTQNPAAVVEAQIRQNTRFRICLRVSSKEDSTELIGIPDAWDLPSGKAFFQVKQPMKFQGAYTGAPHRNDDSILLIKENGDRELIYSHKDQYKVQTKLETEAEAIIKRIQEASHSMGLGNPPRVWPDPLPDILFSPALFRDNGVIVPWDGQEWVKGPFDQHEHIIGIFDDPERQEQPLLYMGTSSESTHMLAIGASGSGKSVLLLTVASSIALMNTPSQAYIYCLDFSGQKILHNLKDLPHLPEKGGVLTLDNIEYINRLFSMLRDWNTTRQILYKAIGAADFQTYNKKASETEKLPAIYLLIDSLNEQVTLSFPEFTEQLDEIIRNGRSSGIYVIITANLTKDVPTKIMTNLNNDANSMKIYLGKGEREQIDAIVDRPPDHYLAASEIPAGRGLLKGTPVYEFQIALPMEGELEDQQNLLIQQINQMHQAWDSNPRPPDVEILPTFISVNDMASRYARDEVNFPSAHSLIETTLGVSQDLLKIGLFLDLDSPGFLVTSTTGKIGKTSLLHTWLLDLAEKYPPDWLKLVLLDFSNTLCEFSRLPHIYHSGEKPIGYVDYPEELGELLDFLENEISDRKNYWKQAKKQNPLSFQETSLLQQYGFIVVVIDGIGGFYTHHENEHDRLARCLEEGGKYGVRVIITENASMLGGGDIVRRLQKLGCGVALGGTEILDLYNNARPPYGQRTYGLPPGRGYLVRAGQTQLFQAAVYWEEGTRDTSLRARIDQICAKYVASTSENAQSTINSDEAV
jgi:S-DNA-T family DNA segregation ATPase FtsK/SpoIIIE